MDVGRNEKCPCGSGKKYKHCCIKKNETTAACSVPGCAVRGSTVAVTWCKVCGKRFGACGKHGAQIAQVSQGHVLRLHPETIPKEKFDELLANEVLMAELRQQRDASQDPELWKTLFDFIEKRQRGEVPKSMTPRSGASISEQGRFWRDRAVKAKGQLVKWYHGSWEFLLSFGSIVPLPGPTPPMWGFSAVLYPRGRGSVENDWVDLGEWCEAVGVPEGESEVGGTIKTSPNAVHKWFWMEKALTGGIFECRSPRPFSRR